MVAIFDATITAIGVLKTSILNEADPVAVWFYNLFNIYGFFIFGIVNTVLFAMLIKKSDRIRNFFLKHEPAYITILVSYFLYVGIGWTRVIFIGMGWV